MEYVVAYRETPEKYPIIPGQVVDHKEKRWKNINFLFDTGATDIIMSQDLAEKLGIEVRKFGTYCKSSLTLSGRVKLYQSWAFIRIGEYLPLLIQAWILNLREKEDDLRRHWSETILLGRPILEFFTIEIGDKLLISGRNPMEIRRTGLVKHVPTTAYLYTRWDTRFPKYPFLAFIDGTCVGENTLGKSLEGKVKKTYGERPFIAIAPMYGC
jgi:hypothetical protein